MLSPSIFHGGSGLFSESAVRRSYLRFPRRTQAFWTWLTGKPLRHEAGPARSRPLWGLACELTLLMLLAGVQLGLLGSQLPLALRCVLALPLAALMAGRWRAFQVVYGHHAIHGTLLHGDEARNQQAASLLTLLSLAQNEREYERDHLDHHRRQIFTTLADADARLLHSCGLQPGLELKQLRRRLLLTLLSPRFHAEFLWARLRSNLRRPRAWATLSLLWMALVFGVAPLLLGVLSSMLLLWLPLVLLYQISALLQFFTEHSWLQTPQGPRSMQEYAERCHGRFCGEALPDRQAGARAWARWWARLFLLHLPTRCCVLVGDLPAHDWHHLCSVLRQHPEAWPQAIYARQQAIDAGESAGMERRELWGLDQMLAHGLQVLAAAEPLGAGERSTWAQAA